MNKIKLCFLDEEPTWQLTAVQRLGKDFDVYVVETEAFPHDPSDIWTIIQDVDADVVVVDYKLNESGVLPYTGDEIVQVIRKHNRHLPIFMITSFEVNALQECEDVEIVRGKEVLGDPDKVDRFKLLIDASVKKYWRNRQHAEETIQSLVSKIESGIALSTAEEAKRFDAELYLSQLDLESSVTSNLFAPRKSDQLELMLEQTRTIINQLTK